MSNYMNEAGEPYMTAAQLSFEADLDAQSAEDRYYDQDYFYDEYDEDDFIDADHYEYDGVDEDAAMEFGLFGSET